jgi:CHAT domain-containing protein
MPDAAAGQRGATLAAAGGHHVYHFACHGAADGRDPLDSCLYLADGRLTVRDLLARRLAARLAVLGACETGIPYPQLPDEAVSLPAALLEAGVPGVVGTLWPVEELPTLMLTTRFYELWLGHRLPPAEALHRAQWWLRTGVVSDFETYLRVNVGTAARWPYRSTGRAAQHRLFAHPDYWAAFVYTGV